MEYGNNKTKDRISNERELDDGETAGETDGNRIDQKSVCTKLREPFVICEL